jgi:U6 snRNA-associated Sm-like protein LSm7
MSNDKHNQNEKKKKETILDLAKYLDKKIRVKFSGGREASGILKGNKKNQNLKLINCLLIASIYFSSTSKKGFDPLLNIVLDTTTEYMRDPDDPYKTINETRSLGLVVCRGTSVILISPQDGMEEIANPFANN